MMSKTLALCMVLALACVRAGTLGHDRLDLLAQRAYEAIWEFHPVDATRTGFHRYDRRLGSYTQAGVSALTGKLKGFLAELEQIDTTELSLDDRIDSELLAASLRTELFWLERQPLWRQSPKLYADECVNGVYYLLLFDYAPLRERAAGAARRMAEVPRVLSEARRNVKAPSRLSARAAIEVLGTGAGFFGQTVDELGRAVPELKRTLKTSAETAIRAMHAYQRELGVRLPVLKDSFAMGREDYEYLLRTDKFLEFGADSLERFGENLYAWSDSLSRALGAQKANDESLKPEPAGEETAPEGFSKEDILAYYRSEIDSMKAWVAASGTATVPDYVGKLGVMETPAFLRGIIPGLAMEPAMPLDSNQSATILIRPIPDSLDSTQRRKFFRTVRNRGWKGAVVHEGYPGHHFQMSIANHHPSFIRRLQFNTCLIEGWALYCEQMVVEQGLYPPDPHPALRWLGGVRFRAARVILDARLHTGQMSYDEAVKFMVDRFGPDTAFFRGEVVRYCLTPTQPMSYLVGKTQIVQLRDDYLRKGSAPGVQGTGTTLREFHDRLLAEGSIAPGLIRRKLLGD